MRVYMYSGWRRWYLRLIAEGYNLARARLQGPSAWLGRIQNRAHLKNRAHVVSPRPKSAGMSLYSHGRDLSEASTGLPFCRGDTKMDEPADRCGRAWGVGCLTPKVAFALWGEGLSSLCGVGCWIFCGTGCCARF